MENSNLSRNFYQDKRTQGNSLPPASQAQVWRAENIQATIPIFVPSIEQEQAMIPKRFSKLTALQLKLSISDMITDKLFYAE